ncbi:hypothetical protein [Methylobacterium sp. CG09_land_8_20_14_0_10_71_15]|nr:hypothetical protein [Methylobacterium sp. CG09_land_8_20_14_0_10_71_15]PIU06645.1 MAG: hypothetical protein COT56_08410 [Methylobacterium sp. CG09_land_8_20_14_0_10_71_15]PIU12095.1 MAG: hypothetical protein COT28_16835 [Methylobacterium sp. CG08_land_8_20_14_0_20_71_15]GBU19675.1 hypothetical protein AwMethylo_38900 [Methylobacterium sp.]
MRSAWVAWVALQLMVFLAATGSLLCVAAGLAAVVARQVLAAALFISIHGLEPGEGEASMKRRLKPFNAKRGTVDAQLWEGLLFAWLAWRLSPAAHAIPMFLAALGIGACDVIVAALRFRGYLVRRRA